MSAGVDGVLLRLQEVFGPFGSEHGLPDDAIDAAERELGLRLPHGLRQIYARTGRHPLHFAHNELVTPDGLGVDDDHLVIYLENQGACEWGIPLQRIADDDPPVAASVWDQGRRVYIPEFDRLSQMLWFQAAWQGEGGALPYVGVLLAPLGGTAAPCRRLAPETAVAIGELVASTHGSEVRIRTGAIGLAAADGTVGLGAQSESLFLRVTADLGLTVDDWSYATLRDG